MTSIKILRIFENYFWYTIIAEKEKQHQRCDNNQITWPLMCCWYPLFKLSTLTSFLSSWCHRLLFSLPLISASTSIVLLKPSWLPYFIMAEKHMPSTTSWFNLATNNLPPDFSPTIIAQLVVLLMKLFNKNILKPWICLFCLQSCLPRTISCLLEKGSF